MENLDGSVAATGGTASGQKVPKVDYKELLKPEEFGLFSRLRDWRKAVAVYGASVNGLTNFRAWRLKTAATFNYILAVRVSPRPNTSAVSRGKQIAMRIKNVNARGSTRMATRMA